jgi:hypothetical protein
MFSLEVTATDGGNFGERGGDSLRVETLTAL